MKLSNKLFSALFISLSLSMSPVLQAESTTEIRQIQKFDVNQTFESGHLGATYIDALADSVLIKTTIESITTSFNTLEEQCLLRGMECIDDELRQLNASILELRDNIIAGEIPVVQTSGFLTPYSECTLESATSGNFFGFRCAQYAATFNAIADSINQYYLDENLIKSMLPLALEQANESRSDLIDGLSYLSSIATLDNNFNKMLGDSQFANTSLRNALLNQRSLLDISDNLCQASEDFCIDEENLAAIKSIDSELTNLDREAGVSWLYSAEFNSQYYVCLQEKSKTKDVLGSQCTVFAMEYSDYVEELSNLIKRFWNENDKLPEFYQTNLIIDL
ncbi:MAG: hypothetical protein AAGB12_02530 [Pseudomonadota bacterium]